MAHRNVVESNFVKEYVATRLLASKAGGDSEAASAMTTSSIDKGEHTARTGVLKIVV
jgi:hypothetical protein